VKVCPVNSREAPAAVGGYSQALEVTGASRVLYVSGQIPVDRDGELPADFRGQCRLAWQNVEAQLRAADMGVANLAKVTIFLADRENAIENREVRAEVLGEHRPALTVIITGIFDESWMIEIEAIAVA
jgi:enamine deaminase RidA (YjgF/YER057c/UK114 family)